MVQSRHGMLVLTAMLGCAGVASPETDAVPSRRHLISLEQGLTLLQRGVEPGSPDGRIADTNSFQEVSYTAETFGRVVEQPGAVTLMVLPRRNGAGQPRLVIGVRDAKGVWLPEVLAAGEVSPVVAVREWSDAPRTVTTKSRAPIAYFSYDAAQAREFAQQANLSSVDIALGETAQSEPTPVMLGVDDEQFAPVALDNGQPCPPYCLHDDDPSDPAE